MALDILIVVLQVFVLALVGEVNRRLATLERWLLDGETQNEQRRLLEDGRRFRDHHELDSDC